jgi:hypothetical protein
MKICSQSSMIRVGSEVELNSEGEFSGGEASGEGDD